MKVILKNSGGVLDTKSAGNCAETAAKIAMQMIAENGALYPGDQIVVEGETAAAEDD